MVLGADVKEVSSQISCEMPGAPLPLPLRGRVAKGWGPKKRKTATDVVLFG